MNTTRSPSSEVDVGADHGAEQLDGAFLHGIGDRAEPSGEIAIEAMLGTGSVTALVEQNSVVGDGDAEAGER